MRLQQIAKHKCNSTLLNTNAPNQNYCDYLRSTRKHQLESVKFHVHKLEGSLVQINTGDIKLINKRVSYIKFIADSITVVPKQDSWSWNKIECPNDIITGNKEDKARKPQHVRLSVTTS